jgi:hypothetical protein
MYSPFVRGARIFFKWLTWIFALAILVQAYIAGVALFADSAHWTWHGQFAMYLSAIPVLMFVVSLAAKVTTAVRVQTAVLILLIILMILTGMFASKFGYLSAFHPLIALFLFFRTMNTIREVNALFR